MIDLDKTRLVAIVGDMNSGKTNLAVHIMRAYKGDRKIYTLGYPKQIDGFASLNKKRDINKLSNSIICIDELSKFFPVVSRRTPQDFISLVRVLAHKNNTIITTTQLSQDLTKTMEAFVDTFLITRLADLRFLKLGSKIKFAVQDCADIRMNGEALDLIPGEYLQSCQASLPGEDGIKSFPFQEIGKDWVREVSVQVQSCLSGPVRSGRVTSSLGVARQGS